MLGTSTLLALGLGGGAMIYRHRNQPPVPSPLLQSLVDTIVPRDADAGGLDIGLDQQLFQQTQKMPKRKELIDRLLDAITNLSIRQFKTEFHQCEVDQREQLLNSLLSDTKNVIARRDLMRIRNTLLGMYYRSVEGTDSIGYLLPARYPAYRK